MCEVEHMCVLGIEMQHGHAANFSGHAGIKGLDSLGFSSLQKILSLSLSLTPSFTAVHRITLLIFFFTLRIYTYQQHIMIIILYTFYNFVDILR